MCPAKTEWLAILKFSSDRFLDSLWFFHQHPTVLGNLHSELYLSTSDHLMKYVVFMIKV